MKPMTIVFEPATELDMEEIYDLAGLNRAEATGIHSNNHKEEMIKSYENSIEHGAFFLVGRMDGELSGWVLVDKSFDWVTSEEIGWISDVYVKEKFRRKGLAKELLQESLVYFKDKGFNDVRLNVFSFNEKAIKLYEQIGFQDVCKFMKINI
jgi:ribosomal protein S18 acetylase RimI-like enzyme